MPVLDLSQGVPGTPPPPELLKALAEASSMPECCGYGPVAGDTSMRNAVVGEMHHVYGMDADIALDDVVITGGCNMAFLAVIMAIASAGDEVILPVPWYALLAILRITNRLLHRFHRYFNHQCA
jgi:aspartate/methionine/tyrosine aminotransferase